MTDHRRHFNFDLAVTYRVPMIIIVTALFVTTEVTATKREQHK